MARRPDQPKRQVTYKVVKTAFVNGVRVYPGTERNPNYVTADEGLEGEALQIAKGGSVAADTQAGDGQQ